MYHNESESIALLCGDISKDEYDEIRQRRNDKIDFNINMFVIFMLVAFYSFVFWFCTDYTGPITWLVSL